MSEFKTRDQIMAERKAVERTKAMDDRSKQRPTFAVYPIQTSGTKSFELVVRNPTPELRETVKNLGYKLTEDMANRYAIVVSTPAEMDIARNPLKAMFDAKGEWIG